MRRSVIAFALLLVVAGCGGDPQASPTPTPSLSTASPVSTTPSPPAMPDAARANTKAGAIAFVRHYIDLINYAQDTGDIDALSAVEGHRCRSCSSGRDYIRGVYTSGGHIKGGRVRIRILDALPNAAIAGWTVDAKLTFGPQTVARPTASPSTQELKGGSVPITVLVQRQPNGWSVNEWTRGQ
jgi:hypothetical protein